MNQNQFSVCRKWPLEADAEVVEIFMDEAEELMEELDGHIQRWRSET